MLVFTVTDILQTGFLIRPPADDAGWHFLLGEGEPEPQVFPVSQNLQSYLTKIDAALHLTAEGKPSAPFKGLSADIAADSLREVKGGWRVDNLEFRDVTYKGATVRGLVDTPPKKSPGPCLLHIATSCPQKQLSLQADTFDKVRQGARWIRKPHDIADTAGLVPLYSGVGLHGNEEQIFQLEPGCSFRILRAGGPWREGTLSWNGWEPRLVAKDRQQGRWLPVELRA